MINSGLLSKSAANTYMKSPVLRAYFPIHVNILILKESFRICSPCRGAISTAGRLTSELIQIIDDKRLFTHNTRVRIDVHAQSGRLTTIELLTKKNLGEI